MLGSTISTDVVDDPASLFFATCKKLLEREEVRACDFPASKGGVESLVDELADEVEYTEAESSWELAALDAAAVDCEESSLRGKDGRILPGISLRIWDV